jgi:hypothetical protein
MNSIQPKRTAVVRQKQKNKCADAILPEFDSKTRLIKRTEASQLTHIRNKENINEHHHHW